MKRNIETFSRHGRAGLFLSALVLQGLIMVLVFAPQIFGQDADQVVEDADVKVGFDFVKNGLTYKELLITVESRQDTDMAKDLSFILKDIDFPIDKLNPQELKLCRLETQDVYAEVPIWEEKEVDCSYYSDPPENKTLVSQACRQAVQAGIELRIVGQETVCNDLSLIKEKSTDTATFTQGSITIPAKERMVYKLTFKTPIEERKDDAGQITGYGSAGTFLMKLGETEFYDKTHSSWWNTTWQNRKNVTITPESGLQDNVTVHLSAAQFGTDLKGVAMTDSNGAEKDIYCQGTECVFNTGTEDINASTGFYVYYDNLTAVTPMNNRHHIYYCYEGFDYANGTTDDGMSNGCFRLQTDTYPNDADCHVRTDTENWGAGGNNGSSMFCKEVPTGLDPSWQESYRWDFPEPRFYGNVSYLAYWHSEVDFTSTLGIEEARGQTVQNFGFNYQNRGYGAPNKILVRHYDQDTYSDVDEATSTGWYPLVWEALPNTTTNFYKFDGTIGYSENANGINGYIYISMDDRQHSDTMPVPQGIDEIIVEQWAEPYTITYGTQESQNTAPAFDPSLEDQDFTYDRTGQTSFTYDVNCTDAESDPITYSDSTDKLDIDPDTGEITWTPTQADIGGNEFEITCSDGTASTSENFTVTVVERPDLSVQPDFINFSNANPAKAEQVVITAEIFNDGDADAENVEVAFYTNNTLIGTDTVTIPKYFNNKATATASYAFPDEGMHVIQVVVNEANDPEEITADNNDASKALEVGQATKKSIIVDQASFAPDHALRGAYVTVSGHAYYNTDFGYGHDVEGATVTVKIHNQLAGTGRTIADGMFSFQVQVPDLANKTYNTELSVTDYTLDGEKDDLDFTVDEDPVPPEEDPRPDLYVLGTTYITSVPKKPLDNETSQLKATIKNGGLSAAEDANITFWDNGVYKGSTLINVSAGGTTPAYLDWAQPSVGTHNIRIVIDPLDVINETNENNNEKSNNIKAYESTQHYPDFEPVFSIQDEAYVSEPVDITVTVYNRGVVDGTGVKIRMYDTYKDNTLVVRQDTIDLGVYGEISVPAESLTQGELDGYTTFTISHTFNDSIDDMHNVTIETDYANEYHEISESNNNHTISRYVPERQQDPDFIPISLSFSTDNPKTAQEITVSATITNIGMENQRTNVSFFIDDAEELIAEEIYLAGLGGKNTTSINIMLNETGTYNITVAADPRGEVAFEAPKDNNNLTSELTVYPYLAELRVFSEYIVFNNPKAKVGDPLNISVKVENLGEIEATDVVVNLSRDYAVISDITPPSVVIDSIPINSNVTVEFIWDEITDKGYHVFEARVNDDHSISESNYDDNEATRAFSTQANLKVTSESISFNQTLEVNETSQMLVAVQNTGTEDATATLRVYDGTTLLEEESVSVNGTETETITLDWTPTKTQHTIKAEVSDVVPEDLDSTDNVAVKVVDINTAPYLKQDIPTVNFDEDGTAQLNMQDYFGDDTDTSLTYQYETNDSSVSISFTQHTATFSAAQDWFGSAQMTITAVDDDFANATSNEFLVIVASVNDPPVIVSYNASSDNRTGTEQYEEDVVFQENETVSFALEVQDVDDDQHWYEWFVDGVLKFWGYGASLFSWAFGFADAGEHNITAVINDSQGATVSQEWNVTVENVNQPPYFVDVVATAGQELNYYVNCSDDDNETLYYYDDVSEFDIGLNTGLIAWTPTANDVGVLPVNVICGDQEANLTREYYIKVV